MPGVLPMVAAMARRGVRRVVVARSAAVEAGLVEGVEVLPVDTLTRRGRAGAIAAVALVADRVAARRPRR